MAETPVWRPTARLLVVDPDQRVLLFSSVDSAGRTWWFTPGGGVHRGETVTEAAVRELSEETGYACTEAELGPVVAISSALWRGDHDGTLFLGAHSFFFLRVPHPVIDTDGQEEFERSLISGHRWWTFDELRETTDDVLPHTLVDLLDRLVGGDIPSRPIRLPRS
jgi:8-oxo-dGTP pyrophosphatase MutT (NUDIX family)